ncbi:MAG: DUF6529 family protein [Candidatus Aminicenantes bacterium]|nr:DUF6529 family protein [Candidatus Aminicenantes bacterium]
MSELILKIIFASMFVIASTGAFLTMMTLMGKPGGAGDPAKLRKLHRTLGWTAVVLLAPLVYFGLEFVKEMGDGMSTRAVFHIVLAETLIVLLFLKVLVVRFFKGFLKNAPALGMALFVLTLVVYLITAGFMLVHGFAG